MVCSNTLLRVLAHDDARLPVCQAALSWPLHPGYHPDGMATGDQGDAGCEFQFQLMPGSPHTLSREDWDGETD